MFDKITAFLTQKILRLGFSMEEQDCVANIYQSFQAFSSKLHTCYYRHIEDVHVTSCTEKYYF